MIVVDGKGNAIPVKEGEQIKNREDGKWIDVKDATGKSTGTRVDEGHKPGPKHPDPRSHKQHTHIKGIKNSDGTPWLPIKE